MLLFFSITIWIVEYMQFVCNYFLLFRSEILDENMLPEYETILYEQNMWPEYVTRRCTQNMWLQNVSYLKSVGGVVTRMWDPFNNLIAKKINLFLNYLKLSRILKIHQMMKRRNIRIKCQLLSWSRVSTLATWPRQTPPLVLMILLRSPNISSSSFPVLQYKTRGK